MYSCRRDQSCVFACTQEEETPDNFPPSCKQVAVYSLNDGTSATTLPQYGTFLHVQHYLTDCSKAGDLEHSFYQHLKNTRIALCLGENCRRTMETYFGNEEVFVLLLEDFFLNVILDVFVPSDDVLVLVQLIGNRLSEGSLLYKPRNLMKLMTGIMEPKYNKKYTAVDSSGDESEDSVATTVCLPKKRKYLPTIEEISNDGSITLDEIQLPTEKPGPSVEARPMETVDPRVLERNFPFESFGVCRERDLTDACPLPGPSATFVSEDQVDKSDDQKIPPLEKC